MMLGEDDVYRCRFCDGRFSVETWLSRNYLEAEFWTDGETIGPFLPEVLPGFGPCPHCGQLLWLSEQSRCEVWLDLSDLDEWDPDPPAPEPPTPEPPTPEQEPEPEPDPELADFETPEFQLPEFQLAEPEPAPPPPQPAKAPRAPAPPAIPRPEETPCLRMGRAPAALIFAELATARPDREKPLRLEAWRRSHDERREPVRQGESTAPLSEQETANLRRLLELLTAQDDPYLTVEMWRELGDFTSASQALDVIPDDDRPQVAERMRQFITEQVSALRML